MTWKDILKGVSGELPEGAEDPLANGITQVAEIFTRMGLEDVTQENLLPWTGKDRYFKPKGSKESDEWYFNHLGMLVVEPILNSGNVRIKLPEIGKRPDKYFMIDSEQEAERVAKEYLELYEIALEQTR